jgi:amino acid adenylation domain-containing protein
MKQRQKNRFIKLEHKNWYKTGDIGRRLATADYEILGRADGQVKVRGNRIELSEIENHLLAFPEIKSAVVCIKEKNNEDYLAGYLTTINNEEEVDLQEIRSRLSKKIPDYMIPEAFLVMDALPLTASGKVDRKSLPEIELKVGSENYIAANTETEKKLTGIWEEVLGKEKIGIRDNFFELGGHSLKAMQVISRINRELNVDIAIKALFESADIESLSKQIDESERSSHIEIKQIAESEYYELSHAQKRLWILNQLEEDSAAYNMLGAYVLKGNLSKKAFEDAFKRLVNRHESLRTRFITIDGIPKQVVEAKDFKIDYQDLSKEKNAEAKAKELAEEETRKPFDLEEGPLLRAKLLKLEKEKHVFLFTMHHIISDGWSMGVLINEVLTSYNRAQDGNAEELNPLKVQYKDYAAWQNEQLANKEIDGSRNYWLSQFEEEIQTLNLTTDYPRPAEQSYEGNSYQFSFDKDLTKNLNNIAKENRSSLFMVLLSGFYGILTRYSGQKDIVIGSPTAGRNHHDLERLIGFFVNTLALRIKSENETSYKELLERVKETTLSAYEHQQYPFDKLVEDLDLEKDLSRSAVFDLMFSLQNMNVNREETTFKNIEVESLSRENKTSKFDLSLTSYELEDKLYFDLEYGTKLFKEETMIQFAKHFESFLREVVKDQEEAITDLDFLSEEEKKRLLYDFNDTAVDYPRDKTIVDLFEEEVAKNPDQIAVVFEEKKLTYRELNEKANKLAHYITKNYKIKADDRVALILERSERMIISILGVLKTGAAYLPIDPDYPGERKQYMLDDSDAIAVITDQEMIPAYKKKTVSLLEIDLEKESKENLGRKISPTDLIYVIYTSGSTGKPKGVMLEHGNLTNLIYYHYQETEILFKKVLQFANFSFDVSFQEVFVTLLSSGTLFLTSKERKENPESLLDLMNQEEIKTIFFPTAFYKFLQTDEKLFKGLTEKKRDIIVAGEELLINERTMKAIRTEKLRLHNHYGPTESHVITTETLDKDSELKAKPSIGKAISNNKILILDKNQKLLPKGAIGELYLTGIGIARGYLKLDDLTSERFIENPFDLGEDYKRIYKTGDLASYDEDGKINYLGRGDDQVKIRGYRVELGEIESILLNYDLIDQAVVLVEGDQTKELVVYLKKKKELSLEMLREKLLEDLPAFMVPNEFVEVADMPLTSNGKIDRGALKELTGTRLKAEREYIAPETETEKILARIWEEVLAKENIGIRDNFFELGGHSLKAMQVISRVYQECQVNLKMRAFFETPFVKNLSELIDHSEKEKVNRITILPKEEYYLISENQRRMWVTDQLQNGEYQNKLPLFFHIEGSFNISTLEKALSIILVNHESLRTSFTLIDETPRQKIFSMSEINFKIKEYNAQEDLSKTEQILKKALSEKMDLEIAPLLRVDVIKQGEDKHVISIIIHHIISDGWSLNILLNELMNYYELIETGKNFKVKKNRVQYKDYSAWLSKNHYENDKAYWKSTLLNKVFPLYLPSDIDLVEDRNEFAKIMSYSFDDELSSNLRSLSLQLEVSLSNLMLSIYIYFLHYISSQRTIHTAIIYSNRENKEVENLIGFFINTLLINIDIQDDGEFSDLAKNVNSTMLDAIEHSSYPFDKLLQDIRLESSEIKTLNETSFVFQNMHDVVIEESFHGLNDKISNLDAVVTNYQMKDVPIISKFDITLYVSESNSNIRIKFEFNRNKFSYQKMEELFEIMKTITTNVATLAKESLIHE